MYVILTVHPTHENTYRLGLSQRDMMIIKPNESKGLIIKLENEYIIIDKALNTYQTYGTIFRNEISEWILKKGYDKYPERLNYKIIFRFTNDNGIHKYELYPMRG